MCDKGGRKTEMEMKEGGGLRNSNKLSLQGRLGLCAPPPPSPHQEGCLIAGGSCHESLEAGCWDLGPCLALWASSGHQLHDIS